MTIDGREMCPAAARRSCSSTRPASRSTSSSRATPGYRSASRAWSRSGPRRRSKYGRHSLRARPAAGDPAGAARLPRRPGIPQQEQASLADLQSFTQQPQAVPDRGRQAAAGRHAAYATPTSRGPTRSSRTHGPAYLYGGPLGADIAHTVQHPPVSRRRSDFPIQPGHHDAPATSRDYTAKNRQPRRTSATAAWTSTAWRRRRPAASRSARR